MSISRSTLINLSGLVIPLLVGLITVPLYIKTIGESKYGVLILSFTILGYFVAFDFGLGRATAQKIARSTDEIESRKTFWTSLVLSMVAGSIGGLLLYVIAGYVFQILVHIPKGYLMEVSRGLPWLAGAVPVLAILSVLYGTLEAKNQFFYLNIGQVLGASSLQIFPLIAAIFQYKSIETLLAMALIGRSVSIPILMVFVARKIRLLPFHFTGKRDAVQLLTFGGWISLSGLTTPILGMIDRLILASFCPPADVTRYVVPYNLAIKLSYLPQALTTTLYPKLSADSPKDRFARTVHGIHLVQIVQTPIVIAAILLAHAFFEFWISKSFSDRSAPIFIIFLLAIWLNNPNYIPYASLQAQGRPDIMAKFHFIELPFYLLLLWLMISRYGVMGAVLAWSVRYVADALFCLVISKTFVSYLHSMRVEGFFVIAALSATFWNALDKVGLIIVVGESALFFAVSAYYSYSRYQRHLQRF